MNRWITIGSSHGPVENVLHDGFRSYRKYHSFLTQISQIRYFHLGAKPCQALTLRMEQVGQTVGAMRDPSDSWLVRLPDGRVVRAKTTGSVRHHIETGRIPVDSWVRHSPEEDWTTLEWTAEFSDLASQYRKRPVFHEESPATAPAGQEKPRVNGNELRTVGVRGLVEELLTAVDSTLNRSKLLLAGVVGILGAGVFLGLNLANGWLESWIPWLGAGLILLMIVAVSTAILTQMTFVELSSLRPARRGEALARLGINSVRLMVCYALIGGTILLVIAGLRILPGWILSNVLEGPIGSDVLPSLAAIGSLILEVLLWPVLGLALLLGPIVIVEECGSFAAIGQWWILIRRHRGRVFLYEALAVALGTVMTIPFLFPVFLAGWITPAIDSLSGVTWSTLCLLAGAAMTPLIAYLAVANVFVYLNLRYELANQR